MKHETIKDLISNIKKHEDVDINWVLDKNSDEAIVAFALRFLASNLDEEVAENLYDCLS
jgi:hypothetical protein